MSRPHGSSAGRLPARQPLHPLKPLPAAPPGSTCPDRTPTPRPPSSFPRPQSRHSRESGNPYALGTARPSEARSSRPHEHPPAQPPVRQTLPRREPSAALLGPACPSVAWASRPPWSFPRSRRRHFRASGNPCVLGSSRRSQDAVPAQAAPWGEVRRNAPRTDPKPRKNAVSVG